MKTNAVLICMFLLGCANTSDVPVTDRSSSKSQVIVTSRTGANLSTTAVPSSSIRKGQKVHVVQSGETLYSIAWAAGLDYQALARWNGIRAPYVIRPGQRLKLVSPPKKVTKNTAPPSSKSSKSTFKSTTPAQISSKSGWIWPVKGPILKRFSAKAGNKGIDIGGESGRGIRAAADGKVVYAGSGLRGYGKLIIVKHDEVYLSAYAHNSKLLVADGSAVVRGQQIALMGDTGTDRVKLHFEIRQRGKPVNPLKYLPKRP